MFEFLKKNSVRSLFLYRDPRDVVVSAYHYIMREVDPKHAYFEMYSGFKDDDERLMKAIGGHNNTLGNFLCNEHCIPAISDTYDIYSGWLQAPNALPISYEELTKDSEKTIEKILGFLRVDFNSELVSNIYDLGFDTKKSKTFRKGGSSWEGEFTVEHIDLFRKVFPDEKLGAWGYSWGEP